ncbi:hypothetical protein GCM10022419_086290 [Nonomuraea rosea]|uniref:Tetratricopeptide repeat protein n=1 Tax=Nonomuraea rosea TaxID=638574 RepID=A0ABP6YWF1_9ACTN
MPPEELTRSGRYDEAHRVARAAVAAAPSARNWAVMSNVLFELGHIAQAHEAALKAVRYDPKLPAAIAALGSAGLQRGLVTEAWQALEELRSRNPQDPNVVILLVQLYQEHDKYAEALDVLTPALTRDPADPDLRLNRAVCQIELDRLDDAMADLEIVLARFPLHVNALVWRSMLYTLTGQPERAAADATYARRLSELSVMVCVADAIAKMTGGDLDGARRAVQRAGRLAPGSAQMSHLAATVEMVAGEHQMALGHANSDVMAGPSTVRHLAAVRMSAHLALGDHRQAMSAANDVLAIKPTDLDALSTRSLLLFHDDRYDDALRDADHVLKQRPDDAHVHAIRGFIHLMAGRWGAAAEDAEQAMNGDDRQAALFVHGSASVELGQSARAVQDLAALRQSAADGTYVELLQARILGARKPSARGTANRTEMLSATRAVLDGVRIVVDVIKLFGS